MSGRGAARPTRTEPRLGIVSDAAAGNSWGSYALQSASRRGYREGGWEGGGRGSGMGKTVVERVGGGKGVGGN